MHLTPNQINKTWEHPNLQPFNLNHRILVVAVCNLASLGLPSFDTKFLLLNHVIRQSLSCSRGSAIQLEHAPSSDWFIALSMPFDSEQAKFSNFGTIYHALVETSCDIIIWRKPMAPHIQLVGLRNSLLCVLCLPYPPARSSDSPNTLNHKPVLAGEFQVACPGLLKELVDLKSITEISGDVRAIYKIVWEISQKVFDPAADRGAYICQSQSLNVERPSSSGQVRTPTESGKFSVIEPQQQEIVSVTTAVTKTTSTIPAGPDERTAKAASEDSEFTAALQKRWDRELKKLNSTVLLKMRKLARCALISLL
ncbi:hypothetical protein Clacol_010556 [Clathrus columnatus]|uniref:Uncharacterized protein n=1 Tax=Clathrus columnatus TaxID=1419009 RepID=A0AAV5AP30_9AGAM|nr:hypothetical protein Clacol_010556 [Clathrus columnatus]